MSFMKLDEIKGNPITPDRPKATPVPGNNEFKISEKRFGGDFIAKDMKTAFRDVGTDYVKPAVRNGLAMFFKKFIDYFFFGSSSPSSSNGGINYSSFSAPRPGYGNLFGFNRSQTSNNPQTQSGYMPVANGMDSITRMEFGDKAWLEDVRQRMIAYCTEYGSVTGGEFYDFIDRPDLSQPTFNNYGWKNLNESNTYIETLSNGMYRLVLPRYQCIN